MKEGKHNLKQRREAYLVRQADRARAQGAPADYRPLYTLGEELFNAITHGLGALLGVAALVLLIIRAVPAGPAAVSGVSIFGATLILLYTMSSLYHSLTPYRAKKVFQVIDHCSIFFLIAGTYTPFCLVGLKGSLGLWILVLEWGVAALGIALNAVSIHRFRIFSMIAYLAMGWAIIFTYGALKANLPPQCISYLIYGGVAYTVGVLFFGMKKFLPKWRYMHSIWHLFVLAGSALHVVSLWFML